MYSTTVVFTGNKANYSGAVYTPVKLTTEKTKM